MYRFMLKLATGLAVVAASIAVLGTASVPAAKADGGINLCIGCTTSQSTSQGSTAICVDSARCASWFYYGGYLVWGPQTLFAGSYMIKRYFVFSSNASVYYGFSDCLYYLGIHNGCYWNAR
ncbi:MAG: hypothetical protein QOF27_2860 [Gaiellaceae bacterium]|nr:hypothetical protein [Gaiellaceae bacterium]